MSIIFDLMKYSFQQNEIYLLQARPITNLDGWSELEILCESDGAVVTETELFTRANTGYVRINADRGCNEINK